LNHNALDLDLQTREKCILPISTLRHEGKGEFNWWTILFDPRVATQEEGSLRNHIVLSLGVYNPGERFVTDLVLAHGTREDLTGKPYCSTLAFSRKREAYLGTILFPILVFLTQVNGSYLTSSSLYEVKGEVLNKLLLPCYMKSRDMSLTIEP